MSISALENRIRENKVKSRNNIEQDEHEDRADARRVTLVDALGEFINSSNRLPVDAIINVTAGDPVDTPYIYTVPVAVAGVEYSQALPSRTKRVFMQVREPGAVKIQYCYEAGKSGTEFMTVKPGSHYDEQGLDMTGKTIYFRLSQGSKTVEIKVWT